MGVRFLPARRPFLGVASDADRWAAAVVANGGSVAAARVALLRAFEAAEKASGAWYLTDDYIFQVAENTAQALTSFKQRRLASAVAAPTFTADAGYAFNGTTQYLDTGFIASSHAVAMTGTNQRIAVYERTNVSAGTIAAGALTGSNSNMTITPRNSTLASGRLNSTAAGAFTLGVADSRGLLAVSRAGGGTTEAGFKNGVRLTDATGLTVGTALTNRALYIGCFNNNGTAATFRASTLGLVIVGAPLSDAQETAQYNAVQAFMTAVGANV
jgi:hypothetical protein